MILGYILAVEIIFRVFKPVINLFVEESEEQSNSGECHLYSETLAHLLI